MEGMWMTVGLVILVCGTVTGRLTGDHVCKEEKRYLVNVTEYFVRNSTIRSYEWCMNFPPRCSFYTAKLVNDSRVIEKEVIDFIDKCCPGYTEDKNTCTPVCPECINGVCSRGKCDCFPGYKGDLCDTECDVTEWGRNCKFQCLCDNGDCDPKTGSCLCYTGWTGNTCHLPCPEGFFGHQCRQQCTCQSCDHVTGVCVVTTTTTPVTITTEKITTTPVTSTTERQTTKSDIFELRFENNGKFETDNGLLPTTVVATVTEMLFTEGKVMTTSTTMATPKIVVLAKSSGAKVNAKEVTMTTGHPQDRNYVSDEARPGGFDLPPVNKNDLVNGASAATAISVAVIVVAVVIVAANHFIRNKKKMEEQKERGKGVPTVSVYTHSIFHTPLPEPPIFENPIFIAPVEATANTDGQQQRFETHVVCSMNFPGHPSKEYLYDHPPSTGSYRAASIPEPPEMSPVTHGEPLYDEIPAGMIPAPVSPPPPSYKAASLYMNTCGKTRL